MRHPSRGGTQRLVLVGSALVDLVMPVPSLPPRGGDRLATGAAFVVGGGYYVLAAARRAGLAAAFAGRHGGGPMGDRVRAALDAIGVATLLPPDDDGDTGVCVTMVEPDGERTFVTHPGVESRLDAAHLAALQIDAADVVYVSGYDLAYEVSGPAVGAWLTIIPYGRQLVIDPGPLAADIPADRLDAVLARTTLLTLNRREAGLLAPDASPSEHIDHLRSRLPPGALVVVRDGGRGAHVSGGALGAEIRHVPAVEVVAVDTTGAGDVHTGTLVAALAAGADPIAAVRHANAAAAEHVARRHRGHLPNAPEPAMSEPDPSRPPSAAPDRPGGASPPRET